MVTYKAIDYRSGRPVALQVIPLTSLEETAREKFQEQARSARKLDHVNIARVFDVGVEDEHIVFVTEYLQGETADGWVVAHGPMTADAVLRVGVQAVSGLAAAMFQGLTHRSIQPSNVMIVSGTSPEGEWPFVKLLNFGLAGLKLYSEGSEPREFAPSIAPQFASPEQIQDRTVDYRSEIFSLGATMCFLLTGAVPLAGVPGRTGVAERVLPSVRQIPRPLRKVLTHMLRHNPDERPQDPVAFTEELRRCLEKVSRRPMIGRRSVVGLPSTIEPRESSRSPALPIALAVAAVLLMLGIVSALLMPERWQSLLSRKRDISTLGVPIGVPESSQETAGTPGPKGGMETGASHPEVADNVAASATGSMTRGAPISPVIEGKTANNFAPPSASPMIANAAERASSPTPVVADRVPSSGQQQFAETAARTAPTASANENLSAAASAPRIATNTQTSEPPPPAEGPTPQKNPPSASGAAPETDREVRTPQDVWDNLRSNSDRAVGSSPPIPVAKSRAESKTTPPKKITKGSRDQRIAGSGRRSLPQMRVGSMRAEFVGTTEDGSWILQLPNGKTVVTPPVPNVNDAPVEKHHRVRRAIPVPAEVPPDQRPPVVVLPPDT